MYDMILGPAGQNVWNSNNLGPVRFHHDWSRAVFPAGPVAQELSCFNYNIGDQNPAALIAGVAAAGAIVAEEIDTSLDAEDTTSQNCILTHLGITIERATINVVGGGVVDTFLTAAVYFQAAFRTWFKFAHMDRNNIETFGRIEDYPEGKGPTSVTDAGAIGAQMLTNGSVEWANVKPLPRPLPCTKGLTFIRATFSPVRRAGTYTPAQIQGYQVDLYGVRQ